MAISQSKANFPPFPVVEGVVFKLIPYFHGYAAATDGSIWSCRKMGPGWQTTETWHRLNTMMGDYPSVNIRSIAGVSVVRRIHMLVLFTFVGPCPEGFEARHFPNRDPSDNRLCNLEWSDHTTNIRDRKTHGTDNAGSRNGQSKITEEIARTMMIRRMNGERVKDIARDFQVGESAVSEISRGVMWKHVYEKLLAELAKEFK